MLDRRKVLAGAAAAGLSALLPSALAAGAAAPLMLADHHARIATALEMLRPKIQPILERGRAVSREEMNLLGMCARSRAYLRDDLADHAALFWEFSVPEWKKRLPKFSDGDTRSLMADLLAAVDDLVVFQRAERFRQG